MPKRPRHDWSKPLPLPVVIPEVMALQTLADVQTLMRHLPEDRRERSAWRHLDRLAPHGRGSVPRQSELLGVLVEQAQLVVCNRIAHATCTVTV